MRVPLATEHKFLTEGSENDDHMTLDKYFSKLQKKRINQDHPQQVRRSQTEKPTSEEDPLAPAPGGMNILNRWNSIFPSNIFSKEALADKREETIDDDIDKKLLKEKREFIETVYISNKMVGRRSRGKKAKKYILYPDDRFRTRWDFLISM